MLLCSHVFNVGNIVTGWAANREKQKNVNGPKIETGSGRGQVTLSSWGWSMVCVYLFDLGPG